MEVVKEVRVRVEVELKLAAPELYTSHMEPGSYFQAIS